MEEAAVDRFIQENRSAARKVLDSIKEVIAKIKNLFSGYEAQSPEAKLLAADLEKYEKARDLWMKGLAKMADSAVMNSESSRFDIKSVNLQAIREKIESNIQEVAQMEPVAQIAGNWFTFDSENPVNDIAEFFQALGGEVYNPDLGDITLNRRSVKDDFAHGIGGVKLAGFEVVPQILKEGKIVDYQVNWKGRGYDTVVIAAPVTITEGAYEGEYFGGCIVLHSPQLQRFYLHELELLNTKEGYEKPFKRDHQIVLTALPAANRILP